MAGGPAAKRAPGAPISAPGLTDNVAGALCYLAGFVTGILFLVLAPYNQNRAIRFHAFQSIFLNFAALLLSIALGMVISMFSFLGGFFGLFLGPLLWLAFLGACVYMMFSTFQGKTVILPIIGELAQKQA